MIKYRALVELHLPRNAAELERLLELQRSKIALPPLEERDYITYQEGEIVDFVPEISLKNLLEQGQLEEIEVNDKIRKR